jgi:PAS domain S-box-containing protein
MDFILSCRGYVVQKYHSNNSRYFDPMPTQPGSPRNTGEKAVSPVDRAILVEQVRLVYGQHYLSIISGAIAVALIAFVLWPVAPHVPVVAWLGMAGAVFAARAALVFLYRRSTTAATRAATWRYRLVWSTAATGAMWGIAAIVLFPQTSVAHQAFMGFALAGVAAGAVPYVATILPAYLALALPATGIFAVQLLLAESELSIIMGLLIAVFMVMMVITARRMHLTVIESIRLRFDKEALARDLDVAQQVKEQATQVARESDERVHVLADAPFEGIFIHEQGQILDANRTLLELIGLQLEDVLGRHVLEFVPETIQQRVAGELEAPTGSIFRCPIRDANGRIIEVEVRGREFPRRGRTIRVVSVRVLPA